MIIYHYDDLGIYAGSSEARPNPLEEGKFLLPRNSTELQPLAAGENEIPVWDGEGWTIYPDFRGQAGYKIDSGEKVIITAVGPWPEDLAREPRLGSEYRWDGSAWIIDPDKKKDLERQRLLSELSGLDFKSIRPLRAIDNGSDSPEDHQYLMKLESQAAELRAELAALEDDQ